MDNKIFSEGMNLNSSLSENLDKSISRDEFKERMISILIPILQQRFPNQYSKQQIHPKTDRINFACPYCGDSMENQYAKRGNIILDGKFRNFFKCFNCSEFKSVDKFLNDFKINLQLDVVNYITNNLGDFTSGANYVNVTSLLNIEAIEKFSIDREKIKLKFGLVEIDDGNVSKWLKRRLQYKFENFLYNPLRDYLLILHLTPSKKIIGAQKRIFKPTKKQSKYMTFSISKLYELMKEPKEISNEIIAISQLFGVLNINHNLPVTLFEGPLDSFLFKNSVANTGANKSFPIEMPLNFFYDDDDTGRRNAISKIQNNEKVFLWTKFLRDINAPYRKKWDLNDVMIWVKDNKIKMPLLYNYFSDDPLDMLDI